jgi:hypothetical protein
MPVVASPQSLEAEACQVTGDRPGKVGRSRSSMSRNINSQLYALLLSCLVPPCQVLFVLMRYAEAIDNFQIPLPRDPPMTRPRPIAFSQHDRNVSSLRATA